MGLSRLSPEELAAWVTESCAAQGVPVKVHDPAVIKRVGALLGAKPDGTRGRKRSGTRDPAGSRSVAPHDLHAGRVEGLHTRAAGTDQYVVDQGGDNGVLLSQVQASPGAA